MSDKASKAIEKLEQEKEYCDFESEGYKAFCYAIKSIETLERVKEIVGRSYDGTQVSMLMAFSKIQNIFEEE